MLNRITMTDCAAQIAAYLDGQLTYAAVLEWARNAMFALEMPPHEQRDIMDLLQDISASTEQSFAVAAKEYLKLTSPLLAGTAGRFRRN